MLEVFTDDDLVENVMLHAALSLRQPGACPREQRPAEHTHHMPSRREARLASTFRIPSKLVSKSVLAALMCMNESLHLRPCVCVCVTGGLVREAERRWVAALIHNKTLGSVCVYANCTHAQSMV